jgi:CubicO group peptidase (beta-lactamase class C family)
VRRLAVWIVLLGAPAAAAAPPGEAWEEMDARAAGWSVAALEAAGREAEQAGSSALFVVSHDRVVLQRGDVRRRTDLHSAGKPLLGALVGIAVDEGRLHLSSTLAELGIDDDPPLSDAEKQARVIDLLTMRSGVYHRALGATPLEWLTRPRRGSHPPGTFWFYNAWDVMALGTILERAMGASKGDVFEQRIARTIGMQDFSAGDVWRYTSGLSIHPTTPYRMSARDLARVGVLYLHKGEWNGRRILPKGWVEESTRTHTVAWYDTGYGYYWFVGRNRHWPVPDGSFLAIGIGGQYLLVVPDHDLVMVATTFTGHDAFGFVRWMLWGRSLDVDEFFALVGRIVAAMPGAPAP